MRFWCAAILLGASACQQQVGLPGKAAELTFDGAHAAGEVALRAHGERLTHVLGAPVAMMIVSRALSSSPRRKNMVRCTPRT
jgi:hypothetical protein